MKLETILVTSAWPYINATPHLGTLVGSVLSADVVARYYRMKGANVIFVSGSDEHGTPIEVEAIRQNLSPKELTDRNHAKVVQLFEKWGISFDNYTRTESKTHKEFTQNHLMKIYKNGYIFEQETENLYCQNCKRFLPDRFIEGKCPYCSHEPARGDQCDACGKLLEPTLLINASCVICNNRPIIKKTKHWYFDFSKFSDELIHYIKSNKQYPVNAKNFSLKLLTEGFKPRAITRDLSWGIPAPFPGAEKKTIYVWVEAVLGYISATIEYFQNHLKPEGWKDYWFNKNAKTLYFIGKDNIPFHTIILPALLLGSHEDYNLPWNVSSTEFLQFKGKKASKSQKIGMWIDEALKLFPADYWRFFLIATRPETKDTNFSWDLFKEKINSELNDSLGNFVHRTLKFIETQFNCQIPEPNCFDDEDEKALKTIKEKVLTIGKQIESCKLQSAANTLISMSRIGNQYLNIKEPWKAIKKDKNKASNSIYITAQFVYALAIVSAPFIPFIAENLWKILNLSRSIHKENWVNALTHLPAGHKIVNVKPLFHKIESNESELDQMLETVRKKMVKN